MEFMRRGCRGLRCLGRRNTLPFLRSGGDRRHLVSVPQEEQLWVADSFYGATKKAGQPLAINGPRVYTASEVATVNGHLSKKPFLHSVSSGRLIVPDPTRPFMLLDVSTHLTRSGLGIVFAAHEQGFSAKGLFCKENVRILSRRGVFALKDVNLGALSHPLSNTQKKDDFMEYLAFLESTIKEMHGDQALKMMTPVIEDLKELVMEMESDPTLLELVIDNVALLPINSKGILYRRIYNILIKRIPALFTHNMNVEGFVPMIGQRTVQDLVNKLLNNMPYCQKGQEPLWGTVITKPNEEVFKVWMTGAKMTGNLASDLITMLRVGVSHPCELAMVKAILNKLGPSGRPDLVKSQPTCVEVVTLYQIDIYK